MICATPFPLKETGELITGTFAVIDTEPVDAPNTVGEYVTKIVQVALAASVVPQVPPLRANGPGTETVMPVAPTVPLLVRVNVRAALVVLIGTSPKFNDAGVTVRTAMVAGTTSTAPMSARFAVVNARVLPKKSRLGAPVLVPALTATDVGLIEYAPNAVPNAAEAIICSGEFGLPDCTADRFSVNGP
jgi:hypothetical protein